MDKILMLLGGVVLAGIGGEVFVRGAVGLAATLRVPPGIIGATVAAFATSAPEMAVGVNAALAGTPQVAVGDALGSNVVNIGLVMGAVLLLGPIKLERRDVRRDLPFTVAAPLILGLLVWDGRLSRADGAILVAIFAVWMGTTILQAIRERDVTAAVLGARSPGRAVALTLAGVGLLVLAGRLVVVAAGGIGRTLGLDPFLVGATLVAFGTSVPELATALLARLRGYDDMGRRNRDGQQYLQQPVDRGARSSHSPIRYVPRPGERSSAGRGGGGALADPGCLVVPRPPTRCSAGCRLRGLRRAATQGRRIGA